jgi:hypothetical protein
MDGKFEGNVHLCDDILRDSDWIMKEKNSAR